MNEPKVTVFLSTYNQVKYIRKALDSIFMQETSFPYEVVVADDYSTDGTRDVILEYQAKHPDILVTYFTPENLGNCRKTVTCFEKGLFRGEYVTLLEGDDYWLETDRLQVLVDFLEEHPEYVFVSYKEHVIDLDGNDIGSTPDKSLWGKKFTIQDFLDGKSYSDYAGVFRNFYKDDGLKYAPIILASRNVWDFQNMFMIADHGPVVIMDRYFGVYLSRNQEGEYNYNSLFKEETRRRDKIALAKATEEFYDGKYDLTPRIRREQRKLLMAYVDKMDCAGVDSIRDVIDCDAMRELAATLMVWEKRRGNREKVRFLYKMLDRKERFGINAQVIKAYFTWLKKKLRKEPYFDNRRGYMIAR
jgi:glycosyltransferase involved in cell wall biosynthesis